MMARPKLQPFNQVEFLSAVMYALSQVDVTELETDGLLSLLLPSTVLGLDAEENFLYRGRVIAHSTANFRVVSHAIRVEMNSMVVQIKRIQTAVSALRCQPRPADTLKKLDDLLAVYGKIIRYLNNKIDIKDTPL